MPASPHPLGRAAGGGFAPALRLPVLWGGGGRRAAHAGAQGACRVHGTHEWVPLVTAKHQPTPWYSQARALLSAPVMCSGFMQAGALWGVGGGGSCLLSPDPPGATGSALALQSFGSGFWWRWVFLVWVFFGLGFFSLLQMSFIITHAFSDMEKTFLTSNTLLLLTMSKHLVFTSFPPPNYFAVRNSSRPATSSPSFPRRLWLCKPALAWSVPAPLPVLMPPAPAELGTRPPETQGPPRLWHGGNVTTAPAKGFGNCREQ